MKRNLLILIGFLVGTMTATAQTIIYVDTDATGAEDGTSWTDAYVSISQAQETCAGNCDIYIAEGIYGGIGRIESETKQYRFYGGFSGPGSVFADRDWETYKTIVSGDTEGNDNVNADGITLSADDIVGTNEQGLTTFSVDGGPNFNTDVLVDGLIFTGLVAQGAATYQNNGGAINNTEQGNMIVRNCKFYGNQASADGGAIYVPTEITNCDFYGNHATNRGGAIYGSSGTSFDVDLSVFSGNSHSSSGSIYGQAIFYATASSLSISNSLFYDHNESAIRADNANPGGDAIVITNCTIIGGGSSARSGDVFIRNSIIDRVSDPSNAKYTHCFVKGSGGSGAWVSNGTDIANNIDGDIQYVDSANLDFRLKASSPAINSGLNTVVTATVDLNGDTRIQETTVDMGAYEGGVDLTAPSLIDLTPEHESTTASTPSTYLIRFDEPVKADKNVEIFLMREERAADVMIGSTTTVTPSGNGFEFSISGSLTPGDRYYILIPSGEITDNSGNPFAGTNASNWSFEINGAPTNMSLSSASIEEGNSVGDVIGTFTSFDPNSPYDSYTYSFVNNANGPDNSSFTIDGNELKAAEVFNVSAQSSYQINVMTTDANGATYTKSFTITIDGDPIVNIPDAVLKQQIINDGVDANSDGEIQESEALATRELNLSMSGATDLTGLEAFSNLEKLIMFSSDVVTMTIPEMVSLDSLSLQGHLSMTSLDLSNVSSLRYLSVGGNTSLSGLGLSSYTELRYLRITDNGLSTIDLSNQSNLEVLTVRGSDMTSLDISDNTNLKKATITRNDQLTSVILGSNTKLSNLRVSENNLSLLNVTGLSALDTLYTSDNPITALDVSNCPNLSVLYAYNNDLSSLNLSANGTLDLLNCRENNNLTYLNLKNGNNSDINQMYANNTALTCVEVSDIAYAESSGGWIIPTSAYYTMDCSTITWDGTEWSNTTGPTASDDVSIEGAFTGGFECADLTINMTLTVDAGSTLIVNGNIANSNSLIVKSGASLITYDGNIPSGNFIYIERDTRYADGKYSFVGSPMKQNTSIVGSDLGSFVYKYDETQSYGSDGSAYWIDASADELIPGKGYTQANQERISFFGRPNDGTITYSATYTEDTDDANEGYHLVSNPYPAAIHVDDFIDGNADITGTIYIWDDNGSDTGRGSNSDYLVVTKTAATDNNGPDNEARWNDHIGAMQGFFVQMDGAPGTVNFTESMRVSGSNADENFFRTTSTSLPVARINLTNETGLFKQAVIGWNEEVSDTELAKGYDGKVFSTTGANMLYTMKGEHALAIQTITSQKEVISLTYQVEEAGVYTLALDLQEAQGQLLYLRDKQTEETIDLSRESYSFNTASGQFTDRFELVTNVRVLGLEANKIQIYAHEQTIHINMPEGEERTFQLISINGQQLMSRKLNRSAQIQTNLPAGVYIVTDGEQSHKIILK